MTEQGNTFQLEPKEDERFYAAKVRKIIQAVLNQRLAKTVYNPQRSNQLNEEIAAALRSRIKSGLNMPRYKLAIQVVSGEIGGQGLRIASKSLWDVNYDNWASFSFQNDSMYCTAMVFGCYYE